MSSHLGAFLSDLVEQIGQSDEILDQRHYRLLVNLSAVEKVTPKNHMTPHLIRLYCVFHAYFTRLSCVFHAFVFFICRKH